MDKTDGTKSGIVSQGLAIDHDMAKVLASTDLDGNLMISEVSSRGEAHVLTLTIESMEYLLKVLKEGRAKLQQERDF